MLTSVSKDVSNWVTGNEVSAMKLLSAVRRLVRRFSQFCDTQTRQCVTICQIIIDLYRYATIHVLATCKNNMICKCTWQMLRCTSLKQLFSRCLLQTLQYGRSRHRAHSPSVGLRTPQLVHRLPMTCTQKTTRHCTQFYVRFILRYYARLTYFESRDEKVEQ